MSNAWTLPLPVTRTQLLAVELHTIFLGRRIFIERVVGSRRCAVSQWTISVLRQTLCLSTAVLIQRRVYWRARSSQIGISRLLPLRLVN